MNWVVSQGSRAVRRVFLVGPAVGPFHRPNKENDKSGKSVKHQRHPNIQRTALGSGVQPCEHHISSARPTLDDDNDNHRQMTMTTTSGSNHGEQDDKEKDDVTRPDVPSEHFMTENRKNKPSFLMVAELLSSNQACSPSPRNRDDIPISA